MTRRLDFNGIRSWKAVWLWWNVGEEPSHLPPEDLSFDLVSFFLSRRHLVRCSSKTKVSLTVVKSGFLSYFIPSDRRIFDGQM